MARLWSCGFELNSLTIENGSAPTGTTAVSSSIFRGGAYSMRINPAAATGYITHTYKAANTSNNDYFRTYLYIASATNVAATAIMLFRSTVSGNICSIRLNTNNTLELWNEQAAVQRGSDSSALSTGTWYMVELVYDRAAGTTSGYINGVQFATGAINTTYTTEAVRLGVIDSATADLYFDDLAINDNTGSQQTGLPGAGMIKHLKPNANGDNSQWTRSAGSNNYENVDEVTPDDATTYNYSRTTNEIDDYNIEASGLTSEPITLVHVGFRASRSSGTTSSEAVPRIKASASGTVEEGTPETASNGSFRTNDLDTNNGSPYPLTAYFKPGGAVAWTPADLDVAQIGVRTSTGSGDRYFHLSAIWLLVEYTEVTTQTLTMPAISSGAALYSPTITTGAVSLTMPIISSGSVLYAPTLSVGAVTLSLPLIASGSVLYAPTITTGAISITLPFISAGSALYNPTVSPGAVTLSLPQIASGSVLYAPTISGGVVTLFLPLIASGSVLYNPTLTTGAVSLTLPSISSGAVLYTPTINRGAVAIVMPAINSGVVLFAPTINVGAVSLVLPFISSGASIYTPTITRGPVSLSLPFISSGASLYLPVVTRGAVSLLLPQIASTAVLYPIQIISGTNLSLPLINDVDHLYAFRVWLAAEEELPQGDDRDVYLSNEDEVAGQLYGEPSTISMDNANARY